METAAAGGAGVITGRCCSCAPSAGCGDAGSRDPSSVDREHLRQHVRRRRDRSSAPTDGPRRSNSGSTGNAIATRCRPQPRHPGAAKPWQPRSPARTTSRSDADDSPSPGRRRHMTGNPVVERHGPWPGRRRPLAGRPPAAAWLRPGSSRDRRYPRIIRPHDLHHIGALPLPISSRLNQPQNRSHPPPPKRE